MIESDLQSFSGFVLESVVWLKGSTFSASVALLGLMQRLRADGAVSGSPFPVLLSLCGQRLQVDWNEQSAPIVSFAQLPPQELAECLRQHLQDSTVTTDPEVLLQRNAEMMRHFEEARARNEKELASLQQALESGRTELRELLHQAETDPLTGLYNRRAFDARLEKMFRHTMRQRNSPLSLLLFDLDHFKDINDQFGHQFGDTYLNKMANVLRSILREDVDFSFRFGGDEFAVVIYADYPMACDKAQQVLRMMESKVSIGITAINANTSDGLALNEFIRRADDALYEAKRSGRGRIMVDICLSAGSSEECPCPKMESSSCNRFVEFVGEHISPCPQMTMPLYD